MKIILGSSSPRRQELIKKITNDFKILVSTKDEIFDNNLPIDEALKKVAYEKAQDIVNKNNIGSSTLITADTIVYHNNKIYGKPISDEEAYEMLKSYSGCSHEVKTGVCIYSKKEVKTFVCTSKVHFKDLTDSEINNLISLKEHSDKAGAYGLQSSAKSLVTKIEGDYDNIIGLPITELRKYIR